MAGYREACRWIAENDNAGTDDNAEDVSGYLTTALVADLYGKETAAVARSVMNYRRKYLKRLGR